MLKTNEIGGQAIEIVETGGQPVVIVETGGQPVVIVGGDVGTSENTDPLEATATIDGTSITFAVSNWQGDQYAHVSLAPSTTGTSPTGSAVGELYLYADDTEVTVDVAGIIEEGTQYMVYHTSYRNSTPTIDLVFTVGGEDLVDAEMSNIVMTSNVGYENGFTTVNFSADVVMNDATTARVWLYTNEALTEGGVTLGSPITEDVVGTTIAGPGLTSGITYYGALVTDIGTTALGSFVTATYTAPAATATADATGATNTSVNISYEVVQNGDSNMSIYVESSTGIIAHTHVVTALNLSGEYTAGGLDPGVPYYVRFSSDNNPDPLELDYFTTVS